MFKYPIVISMLVRVKSYLRDNKLLSISPMVFNSWSDLEGFYIMITLKDD